MKNFCKALAVAAILGATTFALGQDTGDNGDMGGLLDGLLGNTGNILFIVLGLGLLFAVGSFLVGFLFN